MHLAAIPAPGLLPNAATIANNEEELARQLCRWHPDLSMIGLRCSNVMYPEDYAQSPSYDVDAQLRRWNLWGYIDARDGAQAVRLALDKKLVGADVFIIANADTVMSRPNEALLAEVFPDVPLTRPVGPHETLLSIDRARRVLGYEPQHSWRNGTAGRWAAACDATGAVKGPALQAPPRSFPPRLQGWPLVLGC